MQVVHSPTDIETLTGTVPLAGESWGTCEARKAVHAQVIKPYKGHTHTLVLLLDAH